ncbi:uncharacterized protein LOC125825359 [Solanum verrucosum]|uniref:uncharacterized protein LOC125825359 n=1 Tax=Solanum verrucosum TaxID=315347 RepID=UPI0020D0E6BF|nr:uncharacterized protein LOC125825359 [Solanum verrucosum]
MTAKGMNLSYILPIIQEGKVLIKEKWQKAFVLYVVGNTLSIGAIERFVASQWNFVMKPKVFYHNEGPYNIFNRPIIINPWSAEFNFKEEVLNAVPIWVKLPDLPLNWWSVSTLSKIGSGLGTPLYADACTTNIDRISYARILVEMDAAKPLPEAIKIGDPKGKIIDQKIVYDWRRVYCQKCCQVGHNCSTWRDTGMKQARKEQVNPAPPRKEWKMKQILDPPTNPNIDAQGREITQLIEPEITSNDGWQETMKSSASKDATRVGMHMDKGLETSNSFTPLTQAVTQVTHMEIMQEIGVHGQQSGGKVAQHKTQF